MLKQKSSENNAKIGALTFRMVNIISILLINIIDFFTVA